MVRLCSTPACYGYVGSKVAVPADCEIWAKGVAWQSHGVACQKSGAQELTGPVNAIAALKISSQLPLTALGLNFQEGQACTFAATHH